MENQVHHTDAYYLDTNFVNVGELSEQLQKRLEREDHTTLKLPKVKLGVKGCSVVAKFVARTNALTVLDLSSCYICGKVTDWQGVRVIDPNNSGLMALVRGILTNQVPLEELYLQHNSINCKGASIIATMINPPKQLVVGTESRETKVTLKVLDVSFNSIWESGCEALAHAIQHTKIVKRLDVSHNAIRDRGCRALLQCIGSQSGLEWLNMQSNFIFDSACVEAIKASWHCEHMELLLLGGNKLGIQTKLLVSKLLLDESASSKVDVSDPQQNSMQLVEHEPLKNCQPHEISLQDIVNIEKQTRDATKRLQHTLKFAETYESEMLAAQEDEKENREMNSATKTTLAILKKQVVQLEEAKLVAEGKASEAENQVESARITLKKLKRDTNRLISERDAMTSTIEETRKYVSSLEQLNAKHNARILSNKEVHQQLQAEVAKLQEDYTVAFTYHADREAEKTTLLKEKAKLEEQLHMFECNSDKLNLDMQTMQQKREHLRFQLSSLRTKKKVSSDLNKQLRKTIENFKLKLASGSDVESKNAAKTQLKQKDVKVLKATVLKFHMNLVDQVSETKCLIERLENQRDIALSQSSILEKQNNELENELRTTRSELQQVQQQQEQNGSGGKKDSQTQASIECENCRYHNNLKPRATRGTQTDVEFVPTVTSNLQEEKSKQSTHSGLHKMKHEHGYIQHAEESSNDIVEVASFEDDLQGTSSVASLNSKANGEQLEQDGAIEQKQSIAQNPEKVHKLVKAEYNKWTEVGQDPNEDVFHVEGGEEGQHVPVVEEISIRESTHESSGMSQGVEYRSNPSVTTESRQNPNSIESIATPAHVPEQRSGGSKQHYQQNKQVMNDNNTRSKEYPDEKGNKVSSDQLAGEGRTTSTTNPKSETPNATSNGNNSTIESKHSEISATNVTEVPREVNSSDATPKATSKNLSGIELVRSMTVSDMRTLLHNGECFAKRAGGGVRWKKPIFLWLSKDFSAINYCNGTSKADEYTSLETDNFAKCTMMRKPTLKDDEPTKKKKFSRWGSMKRKLLNNDFGEASDAVSTRTLIIESRYTLSDTIQLLATSELVARKWQHTLAYMFSGHDSSLSSSSKGKSGNKDAKDVDVASTQESVASQEIEQEDGEFVETERAASYSGNSENEDEVSQPNSIEEETFESPSKYSESHEETIDTQISLNKEEGDFVSQSSVNCEPQEASEEVLGIIRRNLVIAVDESQGDENATYRSMRERVCEMLDITVQSKRWRRWFRTEIDIILNEDEEDDEASDIPEEQHASIGEMNNSTYVGSITKDHASSVGKEPAAHGYANRNATGLPTNSYPGNFGAAQTAVNVGTTSQDHSSKGRRAARSVVVKSSIDSLEHVPINAYPAPPAHQQQQWAHQQYQYIQPQSDQPYSRPQSNPDYSYQQQSNPAYSYQQQSNPDYYHQHQSNPDYSHQQQSNPGYSHQQQSNSDYSHQQQSNPDYSHHPPTHSGYPQAHNNAAVSQFQVPEAAYHHLATGQHPHSSPRSGNAPATPSSEYDTNRNYLQLPMAPPTGSHSPYYQSVPSPGSQYNGHGNQQHSQQFQHPVSHYQQPPPNWENQHYTQ